MLFLLFFCKKGRKKGYGELCQLTQNVTWQPSITSAVAAASMMAMPIEKRVEVASTAMLRPDAFPLPAQDIFSVRILAYE